MSLSCGNLSLGYSQRNLRIRKYLKVNHLNLENISSKGNINQSRVTVCDIILIMYFTRYSSIFRGISRILLKREQITH